MAAGILRGAGRLFFVSIFYSGAARWRVGFLILGGWKASFDPFPGESDVTDRERLEPGRKAHATQAPQNGDQARSEKSGRAFLSFRALVRCPFRWERGRKGPHGKPWNKFLSHLGLSRWPREVLGARPWAPPAFNLTLKINDLRVKFVAPRAVAGKGATVHSSSLNFAMADSARIFRRAAAV